MPKTIRSLLPPRETQPLPQLHQQSHPQSPHQTPQARQKATPPRIQTMTTTQDIPQVMPHQHPMVRPIKNHVRMFQPRFHDLVRAGKKLQTVRPFPKRMPERGDTISLRGWKDKPYRSKQVELGRSIISAVFPITIDGDTFTLCGKTYADPDTLATFARADGFANWAELTSWFLEAHKDLPFTGILINWRSPDKPQTP